jgi:hypothetical protein
MAMRLLLEKKLEILTRRWALMRFLGMNGSFERVAAQ